MDDHRNDYPYNPQASPQFSRPIQGLQQSGYPAPVQRQYRRHTASPASWAKTHRY